MAMIPQAASLVVDLLENPPQQHAVLFAKARFYRSSAGICRSRHVSWATIF
jgi:hypothetical protein